MIDVTPHHLDIVHCILGKYLPECEARVFGSRYTGTAKLYSDLDIAFVGHEKLDWRLLADIKEEFQESELPFRVDIPYSISDALWALLVVRQDDDRIGGVMYLFSQELLLNP